VSSGELLPKLQVRLRKFGLSTGGSPSRLVILATQEADIRKISVQWWLWANSARDTILKILNTEKGWQSGSSGRSPAK
jgi:hypothetical protein